MSFNPEHCPPDLVLNQPEPPSEPAMTTEKLVAHLKRRIATLRAEVKFLNECIDSRDTLAKGLWERIEMLQEQLKKETE